MLSQTRRRSSRYDEIEYCKKVGPLEEFILCKEALNSAKFRCEDRTKKVTNSSSDSRKGPICEPCNVFVRMFGTVVQLIRYLATEHSLLFELAMWLPLLVMALFIVFVEHGSLVVQPKPDK